MLLRRYHEDTEPEPDIEPEQTKNAPQAKPAGRSPSKPTPKG